MSKNKKYNRNMNTYSVSQNFLTGRRVILKLIEKAKLKKDDMVLEIGAGKGHITKILAEKCDTVYAYEIDKRLYESLKKDMTDTAENVVLKYQDFLKAGLPEKGEYKVFANIPFSQTTAIIHKLIRDKNPPSESYLILEKGAAMRFCGKQRETVQSLLLKPFYDVHIAAKIDRKEYHPMPSVDTAMLCIRKKAEPDLDRNEQTVFEQFVREVKKRGVFGAQALLTKKQVSTALRLAKLPQIEKSAVMSYVQWLCLFRCYRHFHGNRKNLKMADDFKSKA
jgi:Dimethyladenosine transferase (rRNA methylation)